MTFSTGFTSVCSRPTQWKLDIQYKRGNLTEEIVHVTGGEKRRRTVKVIAAVIRSLIVFPM